MVPPGGRQDTDLVDIKSELPPEKDFYSIQRVVKTIEEGVHLVDLLTETVKSRKKPQDDEKETIDENAVSFS